MATIAEILARSIGPPRPPPPDYMPNFDAANPDPADLQPPPQEDMSTHGFNPPPLSQRAQDQQSIDVAASRWRLANRKPDPEDRGVAHDLALAVGAPPLLADAAGVFAPRPPKTPLDLMMMGAVSTPKLFHGSPRLGLRDLQPSNRGPLGPGVYTTPTEHLAKTYAGEGGQVYTLPEVPRDLYTGAGHRTDEEWFGFQADRDRLVAAAEPDKQAAVKAIMDKMWSGDGYPAYQRIAQIYGGDEGAQNLFKRAGFEGIKGIVDGHETLLFNSQQLGPPLLPPKAQRAAAPAAQMGEDDFNAMIADIQAKNKAVADAVHAAIAKDGMYIARDANGRALTVHPSIEEPGLFQITYWDKGQPTGHFNSRLNDLGRETRSMGGESYLPVTGNEAETTLNSGSYK